METRPTRKYTVILCDDSDNKEERNFEVPESTEEEQDKAAIYCARQIAIDWAKSGDWGDEGALVSVGYTLMDDDNEWKTRWVDVEIEPDHDALIARAGGDTNCDHEWVSSMDVEGGCEENPGVWSQGGTAMLFASHCERCGLRRLEYDPGEQRNPGECRTVEYLMPNKEDSDDYDSDEYSNNYRNYDDYE